MSTNTKLVPADGAYVGTAISGGVITAIRVR